MKTFSKHFCLECGGSRWRTKEKGKLYKCRMCGFIGIGVKEEEYKAKKMSRERYGVTAEQQAKENIDNAIVAEIKLKWYQRLWCWFKGLFRK